ncbi:hypothetical protein EMIT0P44_200012 [Pseudomonas sp. IT-P44]
MAMIKMDFPNEATATPGVVNWILNLVSLSITPSEEILISDLDLSTIPDEVDTKVCLV